MVGAGRRKAADAGWDKPFQPGGHRRPRDKEGTRPGRVLYVRNTETLAGVQDGGNAAWWADREESGSPQRDRMVQEAKAGSRKAAGNQDG